MSIFQKSVINKHLKNFDKNQVETAYKKFKDNYKLAKIEKIKQLKEEEYQDGFLRDIFVDVFGYTLKPDDNYNLVREFKNQEDGRKADGAILKNDKAITVIELKSTKTKDLKTVTEQAFSYKSNQPECKYVITSNFRKLRFYIDYANEYEEFDLFNLQIEEFELLYLILNKNSIFSDLPLQLKKETKFHEQNISDNLYNDYSTFKQKLFENLIKNNLEFDKLILFKKSQKLLDRFLFILFAEDSGLLPPNSISRIIDTYRQLKELDAYKPIYDIYKQYFGYMNIGRKGKTTTDNIPAYNGGLFYTDELLDNLKIDDEILIKDLLNLSEYDFNTEVDVNILGHIFEHSLGDIEEITAEIKGTESDKTKSKRKKDGVFYTPKYITQYIVENTIGTLCKEKREELNIDEIEFDGTFKTKDGKLSAKGKKLFKTLESYKNWLKSLKIIDPACGSGAFLNQALNFLIEEHKTIDDIIAELTGEAMRLFDTDKVILENNLYGVDINEESVEIAKLSLWLRTAQKGRKLSNLNSNIKCGNSLIDDPEIAGDKAFDWHNEFPQVFHKKEKKIWHITTATHNSRYSQRMFDYQVKMGEAVWLDDEDEIIITKTIAEIVKESKLDNNGIYPIDILEYNICGDHMHLLLVCEEEELTKIVGKIKGQTARERNRNKGINPLVRQNGEKAVSLWMQKYNKSEIRDENYLNNAIEYIRNNRVKHELPKSKEIEKIKNEFLCSVEHALRTEYNGGFDVVIGNPPYVQIQGMGEMATHLKNQNFETYERTGDLYVLFYELGNTILKQNGLLGYITSNKWMRANYGKKIRQYFAKRTNPKILIDLGSGIFESATVDSNILIFEKKKVKKHYLKAIDISKEANFTSFDIYQSKAVELINLSEDIWTIINPIELQIKNKIEKLGTPLKDWDIEIFRGILTGLTDAFIIDEETKKNLIQKDPKSAEIIKPLLRGRDVNRYNILYQDLFLINSHNGYKNIPKINIDDYPAIKEYLEQFYDKLEKRYDKGDTPYNLRNCAYIENFEKEKIVWKEMSSEPPFCIDTNHYYTNDTITFITGKDIYYLISILNSKLIFFAFSNFYSGGGLGSKGIRFKKEFLNNIPIFKISKEAQQPFIEKADKMLSLNKKLQEKKNKFLNRIKDNLFATKGFIPLSKKLEAFYNFDFKTFVSELKKKKVVLSLVQQDEWEEYFTTYKTEINNLQNQINQTDKEIDQMVYKLYELTDGEIKIVEESVN